MQVDPVVVSTKNSVPPWGKVLFVDTQTACNNISLSLLLSISCLFLYTSAFV